MCSLALTSKSLSCPWPYQKQRQLSRAGWDEGKVRRTHLFLGSLSGPGPQGDGDHEDPAPDLHWLLQSGAQPILCGWLSQSVASGWMNTGVPEVQAILLSRETLALPSWSSDLVSSAGSPIAGHPAQRCYLDNSGPEKLCNPWSCGQEGLPPCPAWHLVLPAARQHPGSLVQVGLGLTVGGVLASHCPCGAGVPGWAPCLCSRDIMSSGCDQISVMVRVLRTGKEGHGLPNILTP